MKLRKEEQRESLKEDVYRGRSTQRMSKRSSLERKSRGRSLKRWVEGGSHRE